MHIPNSPVTARPVLRRDIRDSLLPGQRAHLEAMGAAIPQHILSDGAYTALLLIASARRADLRPRVIVDAYQRDGAWLIECHGAYNWQEARYSPRGWQIMYARELAEAVTSGAMPLADIWLAICQRIAEERSNGSMLPDGLQWARGQEGGQQA